MSNRKRSLIFEIAWRSVKWILTIIFMILKLLGVISWHMMWVISPLLLSLALKVVYMLILDFLVCVLPRWSERWND